LAAARVAVEELPEGDQAMLRAGLAQARTTERSAREAQRERVQLHRARNKLRAKLEGLLGVTGVPVARLRVWARLQLRTALRARQWPPIVEAAAAVAMAIFVWAAPFHTRGTERTDAVGVASAASQVARPAGAPMAGALVGSTAPTAPAAIAPGLPAPATAPRQDGSGPSAGLDRTLQVQYGTPFGTGSIGTRPAGSDEPIACARIMRQQLACVADPDPTLTSPAPPLPAPPPPPSPPSSIPGAP
jgi:hypothetical protein